VEMLQILEVAKERQTRENQEEPLEFTRTMGVKKKTKIGECIILKKGAINTHHQSLFFVL